MDGHSSGNPTPGRIGLNRIKVLQSTLAGIMHIGCIVGRTLHGKVLQRNLVMAGHRSGNPTPGRLGRKRRKVLQSTLGAQMAGEENEKEEEEEEEKEKEEEREERGERQVRQRKVLQSTVWSSPRRQ